MASKPFNDNADNKMVLYHKDMYDTLGKLGKGLKNNDIFKMPALPKPVGAVGAQRAGKGSYLDEAYLRKELVSDRLKY